MIVTDLKYGLENRLIKKLDLMITRCERKQPKKDASIIVEGSEGEGKSSSSVAIAYYIKSKTKRDIHLFFKLESLIQFAQSTEGKIIIWDEPALEFLSIDHYKEINKNLIRLLMTVRKKRHFFIFNFTKFYKFSEYIVVDRSLALIHMYSRNEVEPGRFVYIKRKNLELLYNGYKFSKKRLYKRLGSFYGTFPEVLEKHFDKMHITVENVKNASYKEYELEKDKAILSIGTKKSNKEKSELRDLKWKISQLKLPIKNKEELASRLGVTDRSIRSWAYYNQNPSFDDDGTQKSPSTEEEI